MIIDLLILSPLIFFRYGALLVISGDELSLCSYVFSLLTNVPVKILDLLSVTRFFETICEEVLNCRRYRIE